MMGRTALKITLAVAMAAGLLLGVSGCGKSAEAEKQAPASKAFNNDFIKHINCNRICFVDCRSRLIS